MPNREQAEAAVHFQGRAALQRANDEKISTASQVRHSNYACAQLTTKRQIRMSNTKIDIFALINLNKMTIN